MQSTAVSSISDTMVIADQLGSAGNALAEAGRTAFSDAHSIVLLTSASMIAILAIVVFFMLRNYQASTAHQSH